MPVDENPVCQEVNGCCDGIIRQGSSELQKFGSVLWNVATPIRKRTQALVAAHHSVRQPCSQRKSPVRQEWPGCFQHLILDHGGVECPIPGLLASEPVDNSGMASFHRVASSKSRSEFGGPMPGKVKRLRDIETRNQRLPKAIKDITLD